MIAEKCDKGDMTKVQHRGKIYEKFLLQENSKHKMPLGTA
jgi:hypothetical protein